MLNNLLYDVIDVLRNASISLLASIDGVYGCVPSLAWTSIDVSECQIAPQEQQIPQIQQLHTS